MCMTPRTSGSRARTPAGTPRESAALNTIGLLTGLVGLAGIVAGAPTAITVLTAGLVIPLVYLAGITAVSAVLSRGLAPGVRARLPFVLAVMHLCWGTGFLTSPRRLHRSREADTRVRSAENKAEGATAVRGE